MVEDTLADLSKYAPGEWPQRPAVLTYDDGQIVEAFQAKERGDRIAKEAKQQLEFFGRWRDAVFRIEGQGSGNLQLLMSVVVLLEQVDDWDRVDQVRGFVKQWYGFVLPNPMIRNYTWQQRAAERFSENRRLLPLWLRTMKKPPPGFGTREPEPEAAEPEAQRDLFAGEE